MDALIGLAVTIGLLGLFWFPFWVFLVWAPAGACRCRDASRYGSRRIRNPSCPQHGSPYVR